MKLVNNPGSKIVSGVPVPRPGDCDWDGDVDVIDFASFAACLFGPGVGELPWNCVCFNLDGDVDVDVVDFAVFQSAFTGGGGEPAPGEQPLC